MGSWNALTLPVLPLFATNIPGRFRSVSREDQGDSAGIRRRRMIRQRSVEAPLPGARQVDRCALQPPGSRGGKDGGHGKVQAADVGEVIIYITHGKAQPWASLNRR